MNVDVDVLENVHLNVIVLQFLSLSVLKMEEHMGMSVKLDVMDRMPLLQVDVILMSAKIMTIVR